VISAKTVAQLLDIPWERRVGEGCSNTIPTLNGWGGCTNTIPTPKSQRRMHKYHPYSKESEEDAQIPSLLCQTQQAAPHKLRLWLGCWLPPCHAHGAPGPLAGHKRLLGLLLRSNVSLHLFLWQWDPADRPQ